MVIKSIYIKNFRSIEEMEIPVDPHTMFLGANSAGKSTVLKALEWFFEGKDLDVQDINSEDPSKEVLVRVVFSDFTESDKESFPGYTVGETLTLLKARSPEGEIKLTGRGYVYRDFQELREREGRELRPAYSEYRTRHPNMDLPAITSRDAILEALSQWELDNTDQCEVDYSDATHLHGFSGGGKLNARFKFVFVPGLRDASADMAETKGTVLNKLLIAITEQRAEADEQIAQLLEQTKTEYERIIQSAHQQTLDGLSRAMTAQFQTYVTTGQVSLRAEPGQLTIPPAKVVVRAGEGAESTDVTRQGHGFQRALIITALQYLAEHEPTEGDPPAIFLAIEEPELYQHPVRARHFAAVLRKLANESKGRIQVVYATHSSYFVSARSFENIRLFSREVVSGSLGAPKLSFATRQDIMNEMGLTDSRRLQDELDSALDFNPAYNEVFFAHRVVLVEGPSDAGAIRGSAAKAGKSFDADGVVCAWANGKPSIPVRLAILKSLRIKVHVIFDGDFGCKSSAVADNERLNKLIQGMCGVNNPSSFPETKSEEGYTIFKENIETYLEQEITDFVSKCQANQIGLILKSGETYGKVIQAESVMPSVLNEAITNIYS